MGMMMGKHKPQKQQQFSYKNKMHNFLIYFIIEGEYYFYYISRFCFPALMVNLMFDDILFL